MGQLQYSYGSVRGKEHLKSHRNNQDAFAFEQNEDSSVFVVCDGCGSGEHSEVGAILGARLIAKQVLDSISSFGVEPFVESLEEWLDACTTNVILTLLMGQNILRLDHASREKFNDNHYLFTAVVAVVTSEISFFATHGDGYIIVNGETFQVGPFPGNAPPYLAYRFSPRKNFDKSLLGFKVQKVLPTKDLESFLIGSDGVKELIDAKEEPIPGRETRIGDISQFWTTDRFFKNPSLLQGWLAVINGGLFNAEDGHLKVRSGPLIDDTTIIVGRKQRSGDE